MSPSTRCPTCQGSGETFIPGVVGGIILSEVRPCPDCADPPETETWPEPGWGEREDSAWEAPPILDIREQDDSP